MVKIYGKSGCSFCGKAKALCELYELEYEYIDATFDKASLNFLIEKGFKSVPQIYIDDTHLGGYTEFYEYLRSQ